MSGKIARSLCPLNGWLTIGFAILSCRIPNHSVTPFAGLDDGITPPTVVGTAILLHEDAFCPYFDGLTNHGDLPPFLLDSKLPEIINHLFL